ncbi:MAG: hypothetical protein IIC89_04535 [Chloroflexi bacterium]|nr:hypothetical protein [Chloroflexota bacterium]MCI0849817.1 hypothetical protein [Chloroflexota bacterium]
MRIKDFLLLVQDSVGPRLSKPLQAYEWRQRWSLLQIYYDKPAVHYEVWVQRKKSLIELGLHFEGEQEESYRWAEALAPRALEIQSQLGPDVELEEWTQSWTRLHEVRRIEHDLSDELAEETAERLAQFIEVLEPIVAEERAAVAG